MRSEKGGARQEEVKESLSNYFQITCSRQKRSPKLLELFQMSKHFEVTSLGQTPMGVVVW